MNKPALDKIIKWHESELKILRATEVRCRTCDKFDYVNKRCAQFDAAVPVDVQAIGCEEWSLDEIPF